MRYDFFVNHQLSKTHLNPSPPPTLQLPQKQHTSVTDKEEHIPDFEPDPHGPEDFVPKVFYHKCSDGITRQLCTKLGPNGDIQTITISMISLYSPSFLHPCRYKCAKIRQELLLRVGIFKTPS